jgi:hypothetical protein
MDLHERAERVGREPDASGGVIVEALGEAHVLDADGIADAAADPLPVRGVRDPAGQLARVARGLGRHGEALHALEQLGDRGGRGHQLPRRQPVAGRDRVAQAQRDRIHSQRGGELVHLRLVRERHLDGPEPAHRPAGRVVRVHHVGGQAGVRHRIRAGREAGGVRAHRGRARRVRASVQDDPRTHEDEPPLARRPVLILHPARVAMHVADERLLAAVDHLHGAAGAQCEQAGVDLHRDVLAAPEGAAHAAERQSHLLRRQAEASGHLVAVDVQPLGGDVQHDPARAVGDGEARLGPQERLVLHPDLVGARGHDVSRRGLRVAVENLDGAQQVPALVQRGRARRHRVLGVAERGQHVVLDADRVRGAARGLGVVGGHDGDRLALEAHVAPRQHGLVGQLESVGLAAGHVGVREHRVDAGQGQRGARVERGDPRTRMWAAQRRAPEHALPAHVGRVLELAAHLRHAVRPCGAGADAALAKADRGWGGRGGRHAGPAGSRRSAASCTASRILA